MRVGSLCSGYRGLDAAVEGIFGATTAWVSDIDPGASAILAHHWPAVPNLGDLTTVDWTAVEPVDIVCGGYPCQPFSDAGKRLGTADERHIWPYIADALRVLRPRYAIFENVSGHLRRGFDTVLGDLADIGFDVEWCVAAASEVGAPHRRKRLWILATAQDANSAVGDQRRLAAPGQAEGRWTRSDARGRSGAPAANPGSAGLEVRRVEPDGPERQAVERGRGEPAADTEGVGRGEGRPEPARLEGRPGSSCGSAPDWGQYGPAIRRWERATGHRAPWAVDDRGRLSPAFVEWMMGLPAGHVTAVPGLPRNAMLHALGNGVVPQQAEAALRLLLERTAA